MVVQKADQIRIALENVAITLSMLEEIAPIEPALDVSQVSEDLRATHEALQKAFAGEGQQYEDIKDILSRTQKAARLVWNPLSDDFLHKYSIRCVNSIANIEVQQTLTDRDPDLKLYLAAPVADLVRYAFQGIQYNINPNDRNHRAIKAGYDCSKYLKGVQSALEPLKRAAQTLNDRDLPRLTNNETGSSIVLKVWVEKVGRLGLWPDAAVLQPLLAAIEAGTRLTPEQAEQTRASWKAQHADLPDTWISGAVEALEGSAPLALPVAEDTVSTAQALALMIGGSCITDASQAIDYQRLSHSFNSASLLTEKLSHTRQIREQLEQALAGLESALKDASNAGKGADAPTPKTAREEELTGTLLEEQTRLEEILNEAPEALADLVQSYLDQTQPPSRDPAM